MNSTEAFESEPQTVAILELNGEIGKSLSFEKAVVLIDGAFDIPGLTSVLLVIDSPGGSAFVTEMISNYLKEKSDQTNIPIFSFVMGEALSGGYWLATSGVKIFACGRLSMIGSIGVKIESIDYQKMMEEAGIMKKTITAGEKKALLESASEEAEDKLLKLANEIHQVFIDAVLSSRGGRLTGAEGVDPFNGDFWLAEEALEMGLIDGIQDPNTFIEDNFAPNTRVFRLRVDARDNND